MKIEFYVSARDYKRFFLEKKPIAVFCQPVSTTDLKVIAKLDEVFIGPSEYEDRLLICLKE